MDILRHIKHAAIASSLLLSGLVNAQTITLNYPVIEIAAGGDVSITDNLDGSADLTVTGMAIDILLYAGENTSDDISPDQVFTLTGSSSDYAPVGGTFSGTFSIGGGLLTGSFTGLNVNQSTFLGNTTGDFGGYLNFEGGSLQNGRLSGGIIGNWDGDATAGAGVLSTAKIEVTVVPVPAAVWLFGSGLLGLVGIARRKTA